MRTIVTEALENQIIDLYERGTGGTTIIKRLGVPSTTVYRVLKRRGITIDYEKTRQKRLKFDGDIAMQIVTEYKAGVGSKELARKYGCSTWCIREAVRRSGRGVRARGASEKEFLPETIADMISRYQGGESQAAIGVSHGIHQSIVSRILRSKGIQIDDRRPRGERHGSWRGGRCVTPQGYTLLNINHDDPLYCMASKSGYVLEHRLVMARHLGRPLALDESVHHKDGNRSNNTLDNLQLRAGNHGTGKTMRCRCCGSQDIECIELE